MGVILLLLPMLNVGAYKIKEISARQDIEDARQGHEYALRLEDRDVLPDIYYIIFDRYPAAATLREVYGFDNSRFIDELSRRGFYVASGSTANYLKTEHSLASSLNMEYINHLSDRLGQDFDNWLPLYAMLQDYRVWRLLSSKGYRFIHFGTLYGPTSRNKYADINIKRYSLINEFAVILYKTTVLYPICLKLNVFDPRMLQYKRVIYKFDQLAKIAEIREPTFVFAHMVTPHSPYVFDRDGSFLRAETAQSRELERKYLDQLSFISKEIIKLVDALLADQENPPVIILQSDEGPYPSRYRNNVSGFDWRQATESELKQKMGILNAYYLPGVNRDSLYSSITPVNSFRLVFNLYFNADFKLLPDKNYAFVDIGHPYMFFEISDKVQ
ncbi:hypothetical protein ACFL5X_02240 [Candidatus Omnitrophota bacterium]